ncbi:MAG: cytochrome c3 family protein [Nitrospirota bacterium]
MNHVWRPLIVVLGVVALILAARTFLVPSDFGIHEQGYMYGFHRLGNEKDWKAFPAKFKFDIDYCKGCHEDKVNGILSSPHRIIPCEDCHGPAMSHPDAPPKLPINRTREQCLRCHAYLPYPTSGRKNIKGIDPYMHNPGVECVSCHNPHHPNLEGVMK